jgi:hypothetical protein
VTGVVDRACANGNATLGNGARTARRQAVGKMQLGPERKPLPSRVPSLTKRDTGRLVRIAR